jgi:hypothetical protein
MQSSGILAIVIIPLDETNTVGAVQMGCAFRSASCRRLGASLRAKEQLNVCRRVGTQPNPRRGFKTPPVVCRSQTCPQATRQPPATESSPHPHGAVWFSIGLISDGIQTNALSLFQLPAPASFRIRNKPFRRPPGGSLAAQLSRAHNHAAIGYTGRCE